MPLYKALRSGLEYINPSLEQSTFDHKQHFDSQSSISVERLSPSHVCCAFRFLLYEIAKAARILFVCMYISNHSDLFEKIPLSQVSHLNLFSKFRAFYLFGNSAATDIETQTSAEQYQSFARITSFSFTTIFLANTRSSFNNGSPADSPLVPSKRLCLGFPGRKRPASRSTIKKQQCR